MKRLVKSAFLCLTLVTVFFTFACGNAHETGSSSGNETGSTAVVSETTLGDVEGVKITPPANGIVGEEALSDMPGSEVYLKGVFIKDRTVKLSTYAIGKTEVTYELWFKVRVWAESNGYTFANKGREGSMGTDGADPSANSKHPVMRVNWRDCIVWCNAYTQMLNESEEECVYRVSETDSNVLKDATNGSLVDSAYADMSKKGFRLPTDAEWEYAARLKADKTLIPVNYASGATGNWKDDEATKAVAWYLANSGGKTHPVGKQNPNGIGLYDMSGNVFEWCFDRYDADCTVNDSTYKKNGIVTDPLGASGGNNRRVLRGGTYYADATYCIVGHRVDDTPTPDFAVNYFGFRLAWRP